MGVLIFLHPYIFIFSLWCIDGDWKLLERYDGVEFI